MATAATIRQHKQRKCLQPRRVQGAPGAAEVAAATAQQLGSRQQGGCSAIASRLPEQAQRDGAGPARQGGCWGLMHVQARCMDEGHLASQLNQSFDAARGAEMYRSACGPCLWAQAEGRLQHALDLPAAKRL
jgi:hypothetical protein